MKLIDETAIDIKTADQKGRLLLGSRYAGKRFAVHESRDGDTILTPVLIVPESGYPLTSQGLAARFAELFSLTDNWDLHGSLAPTPAVIAYAREVLAVLHAAALARELRWLEPHLGSNERGQVTMEWWSGERSLTLFVRSPDRVDFLKAWGTDIERDMEDGEVSRLSDFVALCRWLFTESEATQ